MLVDRLLALLGRSYVGLVLAFLYLPIVIMALMSFNASPFYQLPLDWSTRWYSALSGNAGLISATWNSIRIALITTAIATILGTAAAIALHRHSFRGKRVLQTLLFPPIAIPWLITGTAMLIFFYGTGIGRGLHAILLGHVALALPYVVIVVLARLSTMAPELEEAARSLGASQWQVTRRVTLRARSLPSPSPSTSSWFPISSPRRVRRRCPSKSTRRSARASRPRSTRSPPSSSPFRWA
jgi:spermidine/putrescine transport system permease protein